MENNIIVGYKVFKYNWKCLDKQYFCPGLFKEDVEIEIGKSGMHFCTDIHALFQYFLVNVPEDFLAHSIHIAIVIPSEKTEINVDTAHGCTNTLAVVRELSLNDLDRCINPTVFLKTAEHYYNSNHFQAEFLQEYWLSLYKFFELRNYKHKPCKRYQIKHHKLGYKE